MEVHGILPQMRAGQLVHAVVLETVPATIQAQPTPAKIGLNPHCRILLSAAILRDYNGRNS